MLELCLGFIHQGGQGALNQKELQLKFYKIFSILIINELYLLD